MSAIETAAGRAEMSISAFIRSLSLEGAGVEPFMTRQDRAIIQMLMHDLHTVAVNLNQIGRALNGNGTVVEADLTGAIDDARAAAVTVAAELASMTNRAGLGRRSEAT